MPTCSCRVCEQARREGVPYARHGNSMHLPELDAVVDAPEQSFVNLPREGVSDLEYLLVTHWHPDHTLGNRILQARDYTDRGSDESLGAFRRRTAPTVVTTRRVYERTCELMDLDHWVERLGIADVHFLDEDPLVVDDVEVRSIPYPLREGGDEDATAFVVEDGGTTVLLATDDAKFADESRFPRNVDLAVFECGLFERGPDGRALWTDRDRERLSHEPRHGEVLDRIDRLAPERAVLTEIEHHYARSLDDYRELQSGDGYEGVQFAYDGLELSV